MGLRKSLRPWDRGLTDARNRATVQPKTADGLLSLWVHRWMWPALGDLHAPSLFHFGYGTQSRGFRSMQRRHRDHQQQQR